MIEILAAVITIITGGFELTQDWHQFHPVPYGEVKPQTPEWYQGCSNAFKSFNPDTGLWRDARGYHYCHLKWVK